MSSTGLAASDSSNEKKRPWTANDPEQAIEARKKLEVWPLDDANAKLLNEVHPRDWTAKQEDIVYDLIAVGAGAGGLVTSRQAARRGARSAMISQALAGGDCLNVGCVPSKALLASSKAIAHVRRAQEFGVVLPGDPDEVRVDFPAVMERLRKLRSKIAPVDGHTTSIQAGADVYQGKGVFTSPSTLDVMDGNSTVASLKFQKAVLCTGGRPSVPGIPGLSTAPFTTNENLFNLQTLPPRMVILGAGVIALEMAQCFARFGANVTVLMRSNRLFASQHGDGQAAKLLQQVLEQDGVQFVSGKVSQVVTVKSAEEDNPQDLPLMKVTVEQTATTGDFECECLLVATGRLPNVENMGLEEANIEYEVGKGIVINSLCQSSNPKVYAVGDCCRGVPRLTHMSGEMAKLVVQNALFDDDWALDSLVVPATMYTEPEYATVGIYSVELAESRDIAVDVYTTSLEHNDRAILDGSNTGFCRVVCQKDSDVILGATIVADRAGEMINEIGLAIKNKIGLRQVGRNIHCYPSTGEAVMMCGVQYINKHWKRFDE